MKKLDLSGIPARTAALLRQLQDEIEFLKLKAEDCHRHQLDLAATRKGLELDRWPPSKAKARKKPK